MMGFSTLDEMSRWYADHGSCMLFQPFFPPRYVRHGPKGWMDCERCKRQFKLWMTPNVIWKELPREWRKKTICTHCFRKILGIRPRGGIWHIPDFDSSDYKDGKGLRWKGVLL